MKKNFRPLLFSLLSGSFYFLYTIAVDFSDIIRESYISFMLFFPGLTFPICTAYFNSQGLNNRELKIFIHLVFSISVYVGAVWLFSNVERNDFAPIVAGFLGSLIYQIGSQYILNLPKAFNLTALIVLISGLAFLPVEMKIFDFSLALGIAIFLWTISNGFLAYRMSGSR